MEKAAKRHKKLKKLDQSLTKSTGYEYDMPDLRLSMRSSVFLKSWKGFFFDTGGLCQGRYLDIPYSLKKRRLATDFCVFLSTLQRITQQAKVVILIILSPAVLVSTCTL